MQDTFSYHVGEDTSSSDVEWRENAREMNLKANEYIIKKYIADLNISRLYFENYGLLNEDDVHRLAIPLRHIQKEPNKTFSDIFEHPNYKEDYDTEQKEENG